MSVRRQLSLVAGALTLAAGVSASAQHFVGFGDSITAGFNSGYGGYIAVYEHYNGWELPSAVFDNEGVPDESTSQGLARFGSTLGGATHVMIMEGTNDINAGLSANSIIANLQAMAGIAAGNGVVPVVGSPPPRKSSDGRDPGNQKAGAVAGGMQSFAEGNGYPFAFIFADFLSYPDPDGFLDDRVHPNDYGHFVMAHSWHDAARPLFGLPDLSSLSPDWGPAGSSTSVDLTGSGLSTGMAGYLFDMTNYAQQVFPAASVTVASDTSATFVTPSSAPIAWYDLVLADPSTGKGCLLPWAYAVTGPAPVITAVTPSTGPAGQPTDVILDGQNFQPYSEVYFGGVAGTNFFYGGSTAVSVRTPALPGGCHDVRFVCPDRSEGTLVNGFCATGAAPAVTSVTPPSGDNTSDVPIVIGGSGFIPGAVVTLDATPLAQATFASSSQIDAVVPAGFPMGTYDVTVTNVDGLSGTLVDGYTSISPSPTVTAVTPSTVEAGDRVDLTIDGANFQQGARVYAGTRELLDATWVSDVQLTAVTPQDLAIGVHDVSVRNPTGTPGVLPGGLTVADTTGPAIARAYPASGDVGVATTSRIDLYLHDKGAGVDVATIALELDGIPQPATVVALGPKLVHVMLQPVAPFAASSIVTVRIQAGDLASPPQALDTFQSFSVTDGVDGGDADGLPSDWEALHALDPASADPADPDRDAVDNAGELAAGSDPTSAAMIATAPGPGPVNPATATLHLPTGERFDGAINAGSGYGLSIALADLSADGGAELVTGPGPSDVYGPQVRAWDAGSFAPIAKVNFYAYGTLKYGVRVANGAIEGGLQELIVTGPGPGPVFGPQIRAFRFSGAISVLAKVNFFAYSTLKYGVGPGAAFLDADGYAEILTSAAPAPVFGPHVRGFNYDDVAVSAMAKVSFFAFGTPRWGVAATAGDVDLDGFDEILAAPGPSSSFPAQVAGFDVDGGSVAPIPGLSFVAFTGVTYGAKVASGDLDGDRVADIVVGQGEGPTLEARVRTFGWDGSVNAGADFHAWDGTAYGVNVAVGRAGLLP